MRKLSRIINPTLTVALLATQLAPGFLLPKKAQAIIADGAPAIDALGQYDPDVVGSFRRDFTRGASNSGPFAFGFSSPSDVELDSVNHRLFVADSSDNRVLVFNLDSNDQLQDYVADYVLGQGNFLVGAVGTTTTTFSNPRGVAWDSANSRLFIADSGNNRVLVFDLSSGITDGMAASVVLGQADFTSSGGATTSTGMRLPYGIGWDGANSRLFVAEMDNGRVIVFDLSSGITNGMAASNVLGKPDFTTQGGGVDSVSMLAPADVAWDAAGSRLFVSDEIANRVLAYDLATIADGEAAVNVLGQADFTSFGSATTSAGLNGPTGVVWDAAGSRLFVSDAANSRVLAYDLATIADGEAAVNVLGQADFTSSGTATTSTGMTGTDTQSFVPHGSRMLWDSTNSRLLIADTYNNRVLDFDLSSGITDGMAASDVLGQPASVSSSWPPVPSGVSFTRGGSSGGPFSSASFSVPSDVLFDSTNNRLFVTDTGNNRVVVFDADDNGKPLDEIADYVLGQPDFTSNSWMTTSTGMRLPAGIAWDSANSRLFVAEISNNRVLVFDLSSGITNGMAASNVLGQADFTSGSGNRGGSVAANTLYLPNDVAWDSVNSRLFVVDYQNNRTLSYDLSGGITNGMNASNVLGQANFTSNSVNRGGSVAANTLRNPVGIAWDGDSSRLFVVDTYNSRVLSYDLSSGITNGMAASNVLGQAGFTSSGAATTSTGIRYPMGVTWDNGNSRLFVSDTSNYRVLSYDLSSGITNGMAASNVLGQADFTTRSVATTSTGLNSAKLMAWVSASERLIVVDSGNNRVLTFDVATSAGTLTATRTNKVTLSRLAAGASSDFSLSFDLAHVVSSTLTVTFPAGFTVTAPATAGASSSCLSNFGYTSNTLTADKSLCGGPITLGGATITLPSTPGTYTITWVNDDPGSATVIIVSNDQISITATVASTVSFLAVAQPAASTCANTVDLTGADYTLALGTLNVATITESESLNADSSTVERICTQGSTNATSGMAVTVKNANGSSGLVSSSVPADTIPSSASGQIAAGSPGYGVCVKGSSLASDSGLTPAGIDPTATGSFSTYECESASGNIVALDGTAQGLWSATGPTQDATAAVWVRVAISATQPAHNDYADSLTFVATATY